MFKIKRYLILFIFILFVSSCTISTKEKNEIIFEYGTEQYDKKTIYLKAQHPEKIPNKALQRKDTLIIGIPSTNEIFNPLFAVAANDVDINDSMWDPILEIDGNGKIVDGVAYFPEIDYENKVYKFTLKDNLKWQDGMPITSKDIEFTFKVLMDKTYTGTFERDNFDLYGWREYRDGIKDNIEGFKIIDDKHFEIKFNTLNAKKNYYFERIKPIALHVYGKEYTQGNAVELEKYNKNPFGNGPYKFVNYIDGEELRLEANEYYYKGKPKIEKLIFKFVNDANQLELLKNGDIDIIRKGVLATEDNINLINNMGFVEGVITDYLGYGYIAINHKSPIMENKNIRKALAYGLDRESFINAYFGEKFGEVLDVPINKNSPFYPEDEDFYKYEYNPEKAKELLEKEGWKVGTGGIREKNNKKLSIKLLVNASNTDIITLIPIMLENYRNIGIELIVEQMESKTLLQKQIDAKNGKFSYDLALLFTPFANSDPDSSSRFSTNGPSNRISYSNNKVDLLLKEALEEFDEAKRKKIYAKLYKELSDDLPYIFLYEKKNLDVYSSKVKGMKNISLFRWFNKDLEKLYFE